MRVDLRDEEDPPSPERCPACLRRPPLPQPPGDHVVRGTHEVLCLLVVLDDEHDDRWLAESLVSRVGHAPGRDERVVAAELLYVRGRPAGPVELNEKIDPPPLLSDR